MLIALATMENQRKKSALTAPGQGWGPWGSNASFAGFHERFGGSLLNNAKQLT